MIEENNNKNNKKINNKINNIEKQQQQEKELEQLEHQQEQHQHQQQEEQQEQEEEEEVDTKILLNGLKKIEIITQSKELLTECFEILYQEIKIRSENYHRICSWYSLHSENKEDLTIEEAKNIVLFVKLHLSDNPEVTRQYAITLLKKNCNLTPPVFYRLTKWTHDIKDLEQRKKNPNNTTNTSNRWEAVKHCIHYGVFRSRKIIPMTDLCPACSNMETSNSIDKEGNHHNNNQNNIHKSNSNSSKNKNHSNKNISTINFNNNNNNSNKNNNNNGDDIHDLLSCEICGIQYYAHTSNSIEKSNTLEFDEKKLSISYDHENHDQMYNSPSKALTMDSPDI